jgi:hypothetical protein
LGADQRADGDAERGEQGCAGGGAGDVAREGAGGEGDAVAVAAKSMANPVTVVTVRSPSAVEIGGTPLPAVPAMLFSRRENRALSAAATASSP